MRNQALFFLNRLPYARGISTYSQVEEKILQIDTLCARKWDVIFLLDISSTIEFIEKVALSNFVENIIALKIALNGWRNIKKVHSVSR